MNYYPLKCWELRENGSREEGVWRKEGRREKGGRGRRKKGELIRERRAFFPEIRIGVLDPSSSSPRFYLHDCVDRPFSPLFLSSHTRGSTGSFVRAHLVARTLTSSSSSSFESSSRTEPCHHPPFEKKKKKRKERNTRSADRHPTTRRSIREEREVEQSLDSSGTHCHQLLPDSGREIRSRRSISSFGPSRCYLLHPNWRPPLVPLRIISHGRKPLSLHR